VSLSLKATQEDPWQVFARTHAIGQIAPGAVTKLVPFGAFVRVADGIEGLVHISELSDKHIELAEQVVAAGDQVFVKIIDIDLERRRISLSIKQANEGVDAEGSEFDPALYGMPTEYDSDGNYSYPDGFNSETGEWEDGFDNERKAWEQRYADAQSRWESHKSQVARMAAIVVEAPQQVDESAQIDEQGNTKELSVNEDDSEILSDDAALGELRENSVDPEE